MPSLTFKDFLLLLLVGCAFVTAAGRADAAPIPVQVKPGRISPAIQEGAVMGGRADEEFSLLGVKIERNSAGVERLVISYGDRMGKPLRGEPGYFQAALDRGSKRLVIDLAQMPRTALDAGQLARALAGSKIVAGSDMTMDPFDRSTNITLSLKQPVRMRVASEGRSQGKILIELQPESGTKP